MALNKRLQKRDQRREDAAREKQLGREQGDYRPPAREKCDGPYERYLYVEDSATLRISVRIWRLDGRMTEFVLLLETGDWGEPEDWAKLARIDCAGGSCHEHPIGKPAEHQTLLRLDELADVQRAYPIATARMHEIAHTIREGDAS